MDKSSGGGRFGVGLIFALTLTFRTILEVIVQDVEGTADRWTDMFDGFADGLDLGAGSLDWAAGRGFMVDVWRPELGLGDFSGSTVFVLADVLPGVVFGVAAFGGEGLGIEDAGREDETLEVAVDRRGVVVVVCFPRFEFHGGLEGGV